jgi:hypothetical protein
MIKLQIHVALHEADLEACSEASTVTANQVALVNMAEHGSTRR